MRLSKKPLYALYAVDTICIFLFLFIHLALCRGFSFYTSDEGYEAFLMMFKVSLLFGGILSIIFTVVLKSFLKDIGEEFKCLENRISELEKNAEINSYR